MDATVGNDRKRNAANVRSQLARTRRSRSITVS
jgi:hypothetical protein